MGLSHNQLMRRYIIILLLFVFGLLEAGAQAPAKDKWRFYSVDVIGRIKGEYESVFLFQTVNGFQKKNLFLGIGAGLDGYRYTSFPVFADARIYAGHRPSAFFLYADAGVNFVVDDDKRLLNGGHFPPCFYNDDGIGYKIALGRHSGLLLSAGWTYKRVTLAQKSQVCPLAGPCYDYLEKYRYDLSRLIFKLGFVF
jgi:hypothetical protein